MSETEFLHQLPGRPISYYPDIARHVGGVKAAVLLCQLVYWYPKTKDPEGWIYKNRAELLEETGLSFHEQETARQALRERGLIEERYARLKHRFYLRINVEVYNRLIEHMRTLKATAGLCDYEEEATEPAPIHPKRGKCISGNAERALGESADPLVVDEHRVLAESTNSTDIPPVPPTPDGSGEGLPAPPVVTRRQARKKIQRRDLPPYGSAPGFERLWEVAAIRSDGSKGSKKQAFYEYLQLRPNPEDDPTLLTTMLQAYSYQKTTPQWQAEHGRFIPRLNVWLYRRVWEGVDVTASPCNDDDAAFNASLTRKIAEEEEEARRAGSRSTGL